MKEFLRRIVIAAVLALQSTCTPPPPPAPDHFGIYIADLSGGQYRKIAESSWQQMSHPRVSPDGKLVTFTRYTERNGAFAQEIDGYEGTEILVMNVDGSSPRIIIPAKDGVLNCNSSWSDGGKALIWLTTDNAENLPKLMKIDLATRDNSPLPVPADLKTTDPHEVNGKMVFPVIGQSTDSIWMMNSDGSDLREITHPPAPGWFRFSFLPAGDYDPKLSPDGKRVAYMRLKERSDWKIWVVDLATGVETDISGAFTQDIVPDWSSDGRLIIFAHFDADDFSKMGIYTMKPDGSDRTMVGLPDGYVSNHPHFFPGSGSGPGAKFIFHSFRIEDRE